MAQSTRVPTPSGRVATIYSNPPGRSVGPTQNLVPVGPPPSYHGIPMVPGVEPAEGVSARGQVEPLATPNEIVDSQLAGIPKLTSPVVNMETGTLAVPWTQFFVNLFRLAQPTGISAGTYAGITFNVFGQALHGQSSGVTFEAPILHNANLTGDPQAPTPPASDNDTSVATTAFVKEQGYLTTVTITGDVTGMGGSTVAVLVVGLRGIPIAAVVPTPNQVLGYVGGAWEPINVLQDAPQDGQLYGRQNGQWVVIPAAPPPG